MTAYYNEIDPYCAQWLRNLIQKNLIAPGDVDERSIADVRPSDLDGYRQCHFFAGIGIWSLALRRAGWPDDRPVWTGSCPCQPFSAAGKRNGFTDERHLWPMWYHLISQRKPKTIFGEQVASQDGYAWLDLVQTDMEKTGYAFGPVVLPAAGFGAPHGRHRIFFVADSEKSRLEERTSDRSIQRKTNDPDRMEDIELCGDLKPLADAMPTRWTEWWTQSGRGQASWSGGVVRMANSDVSEPDGGRPSIREQPLCDEHSGCTVTVEYAESEQAWVSIFAREHGATRGHWFNADWIPCRDGKWRPIEPGIFPLAHGHTRRMDKLRAFGNAIVPQVAEGFIKSFMDFDK